MVTGRALATYQRHARTLGTPEHLRGRVFHALASGDRNTVIARGQPRVAVTLPGRDGSILHHHDGRDLIAVVQIKPGSGPDDTPSTPVYLVEDVLPLEAVSDLWAKKQWKPATKENPVQQPFTFIRDHIRTKSEQNNEKKKKKKKKEKKPMTKNPDTPTEIIDPVPATSKIKLKGRKMRATHFLMLPQGSVVIAKGTHTGDDGKTIRIPTAYMVFPENVTSTVRKLRANDTRLPDPAQRFAIFIDGAWTPADNPRGRFGYGVLSATQNNGSAGCRLAIYFDIEQMRACGADATLLSLAEDTWLKWAARKDEEDAEKSSKKAKDVAKKLSNLAPDKLDAIMAILTSDED